MKILAFDQSTRVSGFSVFEDGTYVMSGVIDLHSIKDTNERSRQMGVELCNKIEFIKPELVVLEEVQCQSNIDTVKKLARIQGMIIGFSAAHGIETKIVEPSKWRSKLGYRQGRGVERSELKQQSFDYVKKTLGLDIKSEDENEAVAIGLAAQKLFN